MIVAVAVVVAAGAVAVVVALAVVVIEGTALSGMIVIVVVREQTGARLLTNVGDKSTKQCRMSPGERGNLRWHRGVGKTTSRRRGLA